MSILQDIYKKLLGTVQSAGKPGINVVPQNYQNFYSKVLSPAANQIKATGQLFNVKQNIKDFWSGKRNVTAESQEVAKWIDKGLQRKTGNKVLDKVVMPLYWIPTNFLTGQIVNRTRDIQGISDIVGPNRNLLQRGAGVLGAVDLAASLGGFGPTGVKTNVGIETLPQMAFEGLKQAKEGTLSKNPLEGLAQMSSGAAKGTLMAETLGIKNPIVTLKDGRKMELPVTQAIDILTMLLITKGANDLSKASSFNKTLKTLNNGTPEEAADAISSIMQKYPKEFKDLSIYKDGLKNLKPNQFRLQAQGIGLQEVLEPNAKWTDEVYNTSKANGGITINLKGVQPKSGYAYAPSKATEFRIPIDSYDPKSIQTYAVDHLAELRSPGNHLGIWMDDKGNAVLDVSKVGPASPLTLEEAAKAQQEAVFDLGKFEEVPTSYGIRLKNEKANSIDINRGDVATGDYEGGIGGVGKVQTGIQTGAGKTPAQIAAQEIGGTALSPESKNFDEFVHSNKTYSYEELQNMNQVAGVKSQDPEFLKTFDKRFSEFYGSQQAARTKGAVEAYKFKDLTNTNADDTISMLGYGRKNAKLSVAEEILYGMEDPNLPVSTKSKEAISMLSQRYDELYNDATASGISMNKVENYITHVWEQDAQTVIDQYRVFKDRFGFSGTRQVPTYQEGIKMGLTPKYNGNAAGIIGEYTTKLEQAKENISMYRWLQDNEVIVPGSSLANKTGFSPINAPGFPKAVYEVPDYGEGGMKYISDWWAPDAVASKLNKFYAKPENGFWDKVLHATGSYSTGLQEVGLSGGVGPLNFFAGGQTLKEVMAGRVKSPITAFFRSWSKKASQEYFNANADTIVEMQKADIPISTSLNIQDILPMDLASKTLGQRVGAIWNKLVNEATFKNFVPSLQIEFFKDAKNAALQAGRSMEEASSIAAQATKNFYGVVGGSEMALRQTWVKDLSRTVFLAPKYKESLINIWVNSLKGLKNPWALENRANTKFLISAVASYFIYDKVNFALNSRHMNENPSGTEDKMLVPLRKLGIDSDTVIGVPLLPSVGTIPRTLYKMGKNVVKGDIKQAGLESRNLLSFLVKPPIEIMANENYYGGEIYDPSTTPTERAKAIAKHLTAAWITAHPYVNSVLTRKPGEPLYQTVSKAMEVPLRYYTEKSIASKFYYDARKSAYTKLPKDEKAAFDAIPDADPGDPLATMFKYQVYLKYPSVFNAKKFTAIQTAYDNKEGVDPLYTAPVEVASKYILWKSLPPGSQDAKDLKKANPEIIQLATARSDYYEANPIPPKPGETVSTYNAPQPSDYVQKQMGAKNWKDPQVRAYLDAYTAYQNQQRELIGLEPLPAYQSSYNPMKYFNPRVKKVTMKKNKKYAVKRIKLKKLAVRKLKVPKLAVKKIKKIKKIAVKTSAIKKIKLRA
jgi:hypothetical protein